MIFLYKYGGTSSIDYILKKNINIIRFYQGVIKNRILVEILKK